MRHADFYCSGIHPWQDLPFNHGTILLLGTDMARPIVILNILEVADRAGAAKYGFDLHDLCYLYNPSLSLLSY